jgi:hypothetical protein
MSVYTSICLFVRCDGNSNPSGGTMATPLRMILCAYGMTSHCYHCDFGYHCYNRDLRLHCCFFIPLAALMTSLPLMPGSPLMYVCTHAILLLLEHYCPLWTLASNTIFNCIVFSTNLFLRDWDVNPMPNPQPGGPGCLSLSGTSLLTCPAWETLPVATLPPA